jgi:amino acid permease
LTPFLLVKTIEKLKFVSLFAILSISSFSCLVVYNFFKVDGASSSFTWGIPDNFEIKRALASMPTVILAYNWQFNLFPIYKGIE